MQWRAGYGYTAEQLPNYRGLGLGRQLGTDSVMFFGRNGFGETSGAFNYWQNLNEHTYTAAADYEIPLYKKITLRTGFFGELKKRSFLPRNFGNGALVEGWFSGDIFNRLDDFFTPGSYGSTQPGAEPARYDFQYDDRTILTVGTAGYKAENRQAAWYGALNIPLFKEKLLIYGGLRAEYNNQRLTAQTGYVDADNNPVYQESKRDSVGLDFLPSVNLTYKMTRKMQLRAGYGLTVNRPVFREVAPFNFADLVSNNFFKGNTGLYQSTAANADLRWEWYLSDRELISIGGFYKYIIDPIERYTLGGLVVPVNSIDAKVLGAELEIRKNLEFLGSRFLKRFSMIGNFSYLKTRTRIAENTLGDPNLYQGFAPRETRPLVGSSPYIINAGLYYDNPSSGTQISALYNVAGNRLIFGGSVSSIGEIYEAPRNVIDLVYTQRLSRNLSVKMGVQDLLNQSYRFFRDVDRNRKYNPTKYNKLDLAIQRGEILGPTLMGNDLYRIPDVESMDYVEYEFKPGSYYNVGLNFTF
ncbi:outer membrane beta-barrel protein [Desertivirga brevis]|uniref:outer membrane beta-barrel protein n=1 Tax=Desertivirga brevis TaxID=2810310 RepID=UPI001A977BA0|nr:outer membrane beta-barrel protein [Pedobacter sp. SYSU D00873]